MATMGMFLFVALLVAAPAAYGDSHTVGDSSGWTQGYDYATWAAGETFQVGDTLLFNYGASHSVDQVSQADYDSCSSSSPIKRYTSGADTVSLSTAGAYYFICPTTGHCSSGQKLSITVVAATTPSPPPPPGTTASPPPPPGTTASPPPPPGTTTTASPPPPAGKAGSLVVSGLSFLVCVISIVFMVV